MKAKFLVLWNDGGMEFTDNLDSAKLGKLTCENSPSPMVKGLSYSVYQNGIVRDMVKYPDKRNV
jgi:hypothetical protein